MAKKILRAFRVSPELSARIDEIAAQRTDGNATAALELIIERGQHHLDQLPLPLEYHAPTFPNAKAEGKQRLIEYAQRTARQTA